MDTPPHGTPGRAATVRRPSWPDRAGRRRPSGQEYARRRRHLPRTVWVWGAVFAACLAGLTLLRLVTDRSAAVQTVDRVVRELLGGGAARQRLAEDLDAVAATLGYRALWLPAAVVLAWFARWRHLLVYLGSVSFIAALAHVAAGDAAFARAVRRGVTGSSADLVVPAWPVIVLAAVATATVLALAPPGPARRAGWVLAGAAVAAAGAARVVLGWDTACAVLASAGLGCSAAALAFHLLAPESRFPVVYRREVQAHLRLDGSRKARVVAAVRDELGIVRRRPAALPARRVGRLHAVPAAGRGGPPDRPVREAVRDDPPALGPLVQARPRAPVRTAGGRGPVLLGAPPGRARGLHAAAAARRRGAGARPARGGRGPARPRVPARDRAGRRCGGDPPVRRPRRGRRRRAAADPHAVAGRRRAPGHQALQRPRPGRPRRADRRVLRELRPVPLAAGGRPGEHDADPVARRRSGARPGPGGPALRPGRAGRGLRRHQFADGAPPAAPDDRRGRAGPAGAVPACCCRPGRASASSAGACAGCSWRWPRPAAPSWPWRSSR